MSLTPKQKQAANRTLTKLDSEKRRKIRELIGEIGSARVPIAEYLWDSAGTYTFDNPGIGSTVEIYFRGGGAGGASGRKGAVGSIRGGGGGGAPGNLRTLHSPVPIRDFPSQISFTIGAGGVGGASQTTNSTNGVAGAVGQDTTITIGSSIARAPGQSLTPSVGGTSLPTGGISDLTAISTSSGTSNSNWPFNLGGPEREDGGSIDAAEALVAPSDNVRLPFVPLSSPGADALRSFGESSFSQIAARPRGGAASLTGNGQKGGDAILGFGGAGGGAATNDVGNSGAGGRGGDGFVYIAVYA